MKRKKLIQVTVSLILTALVAYVAVNALLLGWPSRKVPGYPIGGSDNTTAYTIDPHSIVVSLEHGETGLFKPALSESEEYRPSTWPPGSFAWNQEDLMKVAGALHQFVWKESLEERELYDATFWLSRKIGGESYGIDYAYLVFFQRQNDRYIVHDLTIDLLYGDVKAGESIYDDKGWKGLNLNALSINNVDEVMSIADEAGGEKACSLVGDNCHLSISLGPSLQVYQFLFLPFFGYEVALH